MRTRYWALTILAANALHLWMFFHYLDLEAYPVLFHITIAVHVAACLGSFWMLADWFIKKQRRKFKAWMWLFFVPWGFLWYYFEVHRKVSGAEGGLA